MFKNLWRSITTLGIWALCAGIAITGLVTGNGGTTAVVVPLLVAGVSTFFMWIESDDKSSAKDNPAHSIGDAVKQKRTASGDDAKMRLLLEMMDDDEREAFKRALKARMLDNVRNPERNLIDGELPYDADIFDGYDDAPAEKRLRE